MQSLQKQFHDFILANDLVKKGDKVLLAVSGGLDSMVLAHLFLTNEMSFEIAHCNYGLRGEESDGDEAFVLDWADKSGINCYVKAFDISEGSIQLEARNARYQWFEELVSEHGFDKVATAHHLNDSLETILINLSRGTGIKGVSGISIKNSKIIRPLLFTEKQRLYDYAMDNQLEWREDSSNQKTDYDRNLLRHDVVPELLKLNPSLFKSFHLTQERLTHASEIVRQKIAAVADQYLKESKNGFQLEIDWISASSDELVLAEILADFGVNYATAKEIFEARSKSGKSFPTEDWLVTIDRNTIYMDKNSSEKLPDVLIESTGEYEVGSGILRVESCDRKDVVFGASEIGYFNADASFFPLNVRTWKEGDRFQPLGMKGEKKVSDFLIDEKVPLIKKNEVLVLESSEKIAWIVGMRTSERFKIKDETENVIKITFVEHDA